MKRKGHPEPAEEPPTKPMLERVEAALNDPDALAGYGEILAKEVEQHERERQREDEAEPEGG